MMMMHRDDKLIEQKFNSNFLNICNWFVDNYLRLYFGKDRIKSSLFGTKKDLKNKLQILVSF